MDSDGRKVNEDDKEAELFNELFAGVFTIDSSGQVPLMEKIRDDLEIKYVVTYKGRYCKKD